MDRAGGELSQEVSYDVYVKGGVDQLGRDDFGTAVAHFVDRSNAVALKRRLEARGETVHVERSTVHGLSETEKLARFSDYSRVPEFEPVWDHEVRPVNPAPSRKSAGDQSEDAAVAPLHLHPGAQEASEESGEPWWRRMTGGR